MNKESLFLSLVREGKYKITDDGLILSSKTGRERRNRIKGYKAITFSHNGKSYSVLSHRVIYCHFFGEVSEGQVINHIDGNKTNNNPKNLEATTLSQNALHAYATGLSPKMLGEKNCNSKFSDDEILEIRTKYHNHEITLSSICKSYGISKVCALDMLWGRSYNHIEMPKNLRDKS